jgi:pimeloyl-ACP methyl ester carboxylesterase
MQHFEVSGSGGRPVHAVRHGRPDAPAVLVLHGFKGFKDWGMFPWIAERIADAGLQAIRFDFSHNGVEARDFDRLDLFLLDTWTRHQEDLDAVASSVAGPLGLLGHSRGGGDALLFAARHENVRCVATLAAVATTRTPDDAEAVVRRLGYYPIENGRTKQVMPMARTVFDDANRHSIEKAARTLDRPLLLIHGTADESVPVEDADRLAAWHGNAERLRIEGAGHTFGAVHPFQGPTSALEEALDTATAFFRRHLGPA